MDWDQDTHDDWVPSTAREWYDWLAAEEARTVAAYCDKPSFLIADYLRERAIARDYEGREILELLQNANDQAADRGQQSRVLVELSRDGLIVANTGKPFSVGGVSSLQTSHLSPKRRSRKRLIGNKGLGFRSVLNWSRTPIILSNALAIAYSKQHARAKMESLVTSHPAISQAIERERQNADEVVLPLLPFPLYVIDGDLAHHLADARVHKLFERCEYLLLQDYDTVVGMPFEAPRAYEAALRQIDDVHPEILLFAQHLGEIAFVLEGEEPVTWRLAGKDEKAQVLANGEPLGTWQVHRRTGELPQSCAEVDQADETDYEIVVAIPLDNSESPGPLYSHFPTDIALPLPVVCHATLELEQNRKHALQGRKSNAFVLTALAQFLADIAEAYAALDESDPWAGCSLLMPRADYPEELKREGFVDALIKEAKVRRIVPSLSGNPTHPSLARLVAGANSAWLPAEMFPEVAPLRGSADTRFLTSLGVGSLSSAEIKDRIIAGAELTRAQRIALVIGLLGQPTLKDAYTSALFLDSEGNPLDDGVRVFLSPSNTEVPRLPHWADLRFLNQEMRAAFSDRLGIRDGRELQQKLGPFGLLEYSLGNLIRALVAEANRAGKKHRGNIETYRADLLKTVFDLYLAEEPGRRRADYPEQSPLYLTAQDGKGAPATSLYLGSGFGADGEITQALYGPWARERLVDATALKQLTDDTSTLRDFLMWLGVTQWPRDTESDEADPSYLSATLHRIVYPAVFEDKVVESATQAYSARVTRVRSVDGLERILSEAASAAISGWLAKDTRALGWNRPDRINAKLEAYPSGVSRAREYRGPMVSYVRWKIESTAWLRSTDGAALQPKDCVLGERAIERLFPRPAMAASELLDRFGVQSSDILEGWRRAGVLTSLAYLERDEIYAKLLELPLRSPDGQLAKPLYHWLLDASETALGGDAANQREFLARGRMWGHYGRQSAYYPITELHHADSEGLPQPLLDKLKIVDLPKRVGADKVERLFGVKPVDRAGIQRRIAHLELAVGSGDANRAFQMAKPYLHKLRASETRTSSQLQALKDLQLQVCSTLREAIAFEATSLEYDLSVWGWVINEATLYVRSDPAKPMAFAESLLANAVCEALASLFRIADGGDFARILSCPESDRLELLRRLRGDAVADDIDAIRAEYAAFTLVTPAPATFAVAKSPDIVPADISPVVEISSETMLESTPAHSSSTATGQPGLLEIAERMHSPEPVGAPRKLVVKTIVRSSGGVTSSRHRVTDGDFCERKVLEFEEASEPARWPILVGHMMGENGPACDVLSFATQEARDAFRDGPVRDMNSVARFIEVKGRGDASATIELRGRELSAAERYGERYFLYRLFEAEHDTYELTVLQDPLAQKEALKPAVHVGMEHAEATRRFALVGGLAKTAVSYGLGGPET